MGTQVIPRDDHLAGRPQPPRTRRDRHDRPVAHVYELDEPTRAYAPVGIARGKLELSMPFPITVDLDSLFTTKR